MDKGTDMGQILILFFFFFSFNLSLSPDEAEIICPVCLGEQEG